MNFTRPFDRSDILALAQTKQPFRDSTCHCGECPVSHLNTTHLEFFPVYYR